MQNPDNPVSQFQFGIVLQEHIRLDPKGRGFEQIHIILANTKHAAGLPDMVLPGDSVAPIEEKSADLESPGLDRLPRAFIYLDSDLLYMILSMMKNQRD